MGTLSTRLITASALALAVGALPFGAAQAGDDDGPDTPSLTQHMNGQAAIDALGDSIDEAAAVNGWTTAQLRKALESDPTAWVDGDGRLFYKEPVAPAAPDGAEPDYVPPFPLDQTFLLHSRPGSTKTLYIDVDGHNVSGTAWNQPPPTGSSLPNGNHPAWTLDGDAGTFNDTEREAVQSIWQRVAEDYAPFDIDVTTQDPGDAGIIKANAGDQVYGIRALVSPSSAAQTAICGGPVCGGVAYVNVFDQLGGFYQPAWVFPQSLSNSAKNIAEAVSHEAGHNFSLGHDGVTNTAFQSVANCAGVTGYYCGHANWSPIMGVGYYKPIAQWSKGEYAGANNTGQNDVALIAARTPYIPDDAGGTTATASTSLSGTKYITTAADQDVYALGNCSGNLTATASPAPTSPNLDIQLDVLDSAGAVVASNNPPSGTVSTDVASGLSAAVTTSLATGSYYLRVDGVGIGTGATGYTDYGSIGSYTVSATGLTCGPSAAPGVPQNLTVTPAANGTSATVTWTAPASDGGSPITGYVVGRTGAGDESQAGLSKTWTGLTPGTTYTFTVAATNAVGTGTAASVTATTPVPPPPATVPGAPTIGAAESGKPGGKKTATFRWSAPASNGGSALTGYTVQIFKKSGKLVKTVQVAAGDTSYKFKTKKSGKYKAVVTASNALGAGPPSAASKAVKAK